MIEAEKKAADEKKTVDKKTEPETAANEDGKLAGLLGLPVRQARQVVLDNCGVSVVTADGGVGTVTTLNAALHLTRDAA